MRSAVPPEANAPLVVYRHRVLPLAIAAQGMKVVRGGHPQVIENFSCIYRNEFSQSTLLYVRGELPKPRCVVAEPKVLGARIREAVDHRFIQSMPLSPLPGNHEKRFAAL